MRTSSKTRANLCSVSRKFHKLCVGASMCLSTWPELYVCDWPEMVALRAPLLQRIVKAKEYHLVVRAHHRIDAMTAALTCDEDMIDIGDPINIDALTHCGLRDGIAIICENYAVAEEMLASGYPHIIKMTGPSPLADFLLSPDHDVPPSDLFDVDSPYYPVMINAACMWACKQDDRKILEMINLPDEIKGTIIYCAISYHSTEVATYLCNTPTASLCEAAAAAGHIDFLQFMLPMHVPNGLTCAALSGDINVVRLMHQAGSDDIIPAYTIACEHYYPDIMEFLEGLGANYCVNCKNGFHKKMQGYLG